MITSTVIASYLKGLRWGYKEINETRVITGHRTAVPFYDYDIIIEIVLSQHWVNLRAFLQQQIAPGQRPAILSLLSHLNTQCHRARFFMVGDCAVVQTEVPAAHCSVQTFLEALKTLCRYASYAGVEVAILATNTSVAKLYEIVEATMAPTLAVPLSGEEDFLDQFDISVNRMSD